MYFYRLINLKWSLVKTHALLKVVECVYAVYYQGGGSEGLSVGADSSFSADSSLIQASAQFSVGRPPRNIKLGF